MPPRCQSKGERHFIKLPPSDKESEARRSRQGRSRAGAGSRAAGHLTCNQSPAYIRGSDPSSSSSRSNSSRSVVTTVRIIRNKAGSRGVTSGVEGPKPG
jgi:hypothetical protein